MKANHHVSQIEHAPLVHVTLGPSLLSSQSSVGQAADRVQTVQDGCGRLWLKHLG